ncbi:hypothetical protein ACFSLT_24885 [Novosphingobium resinovorum]
MPALDKLGGVRKMRCREPYSGTAGWATYVGLARAGVRFCFTLSVRDIRKSIADMKAFVATVPNSIFAIEFPNEPDLNPVTYNGVTDKRMGFRTGNAPALMAFIKDFHAAIKVDPVLRSIPLVASNDFMQAQQAPYTDLANSHIYPTPPSDVAGRVAGFKQKVVESKTTQGIITEWGRTTGEAPATIPRRRSRSPSRRRCWRPTSRPRWRSPTSTRSASTSCSAGRARARSPISACSTTT